MDKTMSNMDLIGPEFRLNIDAIKARKTLIDGVKSISAVTAFSAMVAAAAFTLNHAQTVEQQITASAEAVASDIYHSELDAKVGEGDLIQRYQDRDPSAKSGLSRVISETWRVPVHGAKKIVDAAFETGRLTNVDPLLILAVAAKESSFNPKAKSHVGAEGVMQVWYKWHPNLKHLRHDGVQGNILAGAMVLSSYFDLARGDPVEALQRYNGTLGDTSLKYSSGVIGIYRALGAVYADAVDNEGPGYSYIKPSYRSSPS